MRIERREITNFIETARKAVGRNASSPFSLEEVYFIAHQLRLRGAIYLEKLDDRRHVNVLLDLNENSITLYDPLQGVKKRPCHLIQLGMCGKPVGSFKDEYNKRWQPGEGSDLWAHYREKGEGLLYLFKGHPELEFIYKRLVSRTDVFPALQKSLCSQNCAPIALFIIAYYNAVYSNYSALKGKDRYCDSESGLIPGLHQDWDGSDEEVSLPVIAYASGGVGSDEQAHTGPG